MTTQLPAHLLALFSSNPEITEIGKNLGGESFNKIRYAGSKFKLIKSTGEEFNVPDAFLDVIVVGINENKSHVVYDKAFDPKGEPSSPVWSSDDGTPVPVEHEGKVVSDYQRWAVLAVNHIDMGIFELRISSDSLTNSRKYATAIRSHTGSVSAVVTHITFDPAKTHPALVFTPSAYIEAGAQTDAVKSAITEGKNEIAIAVGLSKTKTPALSGPAPVAAITSTVEEGMNKPARTRAKKEPEPVSTGTPAPAQVFPMPAQSAAAATVVQPKATSPDLNNLIASVLGR